MHRMNDWDKALSVCRSGARPETPAACGADRPRIAPLQLLSRRPGRRLGRPSVPAITKYPDSRCCFCRAAVEGNEGCGTHEEWLYLTNTIATRPSVPGA